ncbi:MAG TPA: YXWGXW repeat-containing protein [Stellaceae bacterium]|nr:YXWGXW repeat-containing protein [Stellaceae bacterium]
MRLRRTLPYLFALALADAAAPGASFAQVVGVSITVAPPPLPVYVQPAIPAPGYIWTPGYWAWGPDGYYWVPGTWVLPPAVGLLWTPGYWGWVDGVFRWHAGYWGPHVGFYGGVNYGFGYLGVGYEGGYWAHGAFFYNTAVNNVHNVQIHNVYTKTVVNNTTRVSFNGGAGGLTARPNAQEQAAAHESHRAPTSLQTQHEHVASANPQLRASVNHGAPAASFAATPRPAQAPRAPAPHTAGGPGAPHPEAAHAGGPGAPHPEAAPGNVHPAGAQHAPPGPGPAPAHEEGHAADGHPGGGHDEHQAGGGGDDHHHD